MLKGLLRYMEFDFDDNEEITTIADTFMSEYNYHYIQILHEQLRKRSGNCRTYGVPE